MRGRFVLVAAIALASGPAESASQAVHLAHQIPVVPLELLERPTTIRGGISSTHDAVGTASPDAQRYFDQGLTYLRHFIWIEAARSFNQALRLDPKLALAYVGLSIAHAELNQGAAARTAIERARALAVTPHDRRHVAIRERQLAAADAPRDEARLAAYRQAIDDALAEFPADVELWLSRGVAESTDPSDQGQGAPPAAVRYFDRAMTLVPDHFAVHHYLTHAYENGGQIQEALRHGALYAKLAPDVPHARHMYGHDLRRVGRIQEAIAEFAAADRLETAYFAAERVLPEYDWHYAHNLDLLAAAYQYAGQATKAEPLLKVAFDLPTASLLQAINKRAWPLFLRARGRSGDALIAAKTLIDHPHPVVQAMGYIESGYACLMNRQFAEAAADTNQALAAMKRAADGAGLVVTAFEGLQGEFFLRTGQRDKGRALIEAAVKKARAAAGPDEWTQALFTIEGFARAAREAGDWQLARGLALQMIEHDSSYAGGHYALALVADQSGDLQTSARERALAQKYWSNADPTLPELREVLSRKPASGR